MRWSVGHYLFCLRKISFYMANWGGGKQKLDERIEGRRKGFRTEV